MLLCRTRVFPSAVLHIIETASVLIIDRLTPERYEEVSRVRLIEPNNHDARRPTVWSHPAFANRSNYARNNAEIV